MEVIYHEQSQDLYCNIEALDTQVLDHLDQHEKSSLTIPLEIEFKLLENYKFFNGDLSEDDGTLTLVHQYEEQVTGVSGTIFDVCTLETKKEDVMLCLSDALSLLGIHEDMLHGVAENIIECGQLIGNLDSKKGPKVLRLSVDLKIDHSFIRCESCSKESELKRDALIMKTLKTVRVVGDDHNHDHDEKECDDTEDDEDEGQERKRIRVIREGEVCPICMEEFVAGSDDVTCMPCSHVFHGKCIGTWLKRSHSNCPICRFEIPIEL